MNEIIAYKNSDGTLDSNISTVTLSIYSKYLDTPTLINDKIKQIDLNSLCTCCKKRKWRELSKGNKNNEKLCNICLEKFVLQNLYDAGLI